MNMIKCPKCGFSQPKDKYCASCGLDIEEQQKSLKHKIYSFLSNGTALQAIFFTFLILIGIFIIFSDQKKPSSLISKSLKKPPKAISTKTKKFTQLPLSLKEKPKPKKAPALLAKKQVEKPPDSIIEEVPKNPTLTIILAEINPKSIESEFQTISTRKEWEQFFNDLIETEEIITEIQRKENLLLKEGENLDLEVENTPIILFKKVSPDSVQIEIQEKIYKISTKRSAFILIKNEELSEKEQKEEEEERSQLSLWLTFSSSAP